MEIPVSQAVKLLLILMADMALMEEVLFQARILQKLTDQLLMLHVILPKTWWLPASATRH